MKSMGKFPEDEDAQELHALQMLPMSATRVARRSLILSAVICRGSIENAPDRPDAEILRFRLLEWLTQLNLWDEVETSEEKMLHAPIGVLKPEDVIRATWYTEGLAILAWSLNYIKFPKHDHQVDPHIVTDALGLLNEFAGEVIATAELCDPAELDAGRELLYAIHSRLRDFARHHDQKDFIQWIERKWINILDLDEAQLIVQNDLAIGDKTISESEEDCWQECEAITRERHRAIIWLFKGNPSYSQIPIDT